jgi:hypothetical protein
LVVCRWVLSVCCEMDCGKKKNQNRHRRERVKLSQSANPFACGGDSSEERQTENSVWECWQLERVPCCWHTRHRHTPMGLAGAHPAPWSDRQSASVLLDSSQAKYKFTRRMKLLILMVMAITAAYAYSWCIRKRDSDGVSSEIAVALGQQANNAAQFFILMTTATVLTLMFPEDLDSPEARRFIGPFLAVSNVAGTSVAITVARGYAETRSEGAQQDANERVCLYIHYALCAFYFVWGVVYPTITFFFLRNSWRRLRLGLFVDAIIF